jgi:hypothetical protein
LDKIVVDGVVHFLVWCHREYCSWCKIYLQLDLKDFKRTMTNKQKRVYVFKAISLRFKTAKLTCDMQIDVQFRSNVENTSMSNNF